MTPELHQALLDADRINAECDELLERAKQWRERQSRSDEVIYRDYHGEQPALPQPQVATMDAESARAWNDWVQEKLETFADIIGGEIGSVIKEVRDKQTTRINALENIVTTLEARIAALEDQPNRYAG